jgi:hypothetical protein
MSGHGQQHHRRGDAMRPQSTPDRTKSQSQSQTPVLSVESSNPSAQPTSNSHTPSSPAQTPLFRVPQPPHVGGGESTTKGGKVAIPRLKRAIEVAGEDGIRSGGRHRVNHACEPCRHRKTKCSGERPICRHCQDFKITCFYADGKRDRVKKYVRTNSAFHHIWWLTEDQAIRNHDREGGRLRKTPEESLG